MTTIYFVRHAESRYVNALDDIFRPLTEKGMNDRYSVTDFLSGKKIGAVYSSPYKRAIDTVSDFADKNGLGINIVDNFRERKVGDDSVEDFFAFAGRQWTDFSYAMPGGECLRDVQNRNIAALEPLLLRHRDEAIVIGTHGTALSTIINHYNPIFGAEDFFKIMDIMPWIVVFQFAGPTCTNIDNTLKFPIDRHEVRTFPPGELEFYKYVVIFARYQDKWVYSRHKKRDTYETAGGHIDAEEKPLAAAKRELYEETGAVKFEIYPMFDYSVRYPTEFSFGQVFYADISELNGLPDSEMAEVGLFESIPEQMTYPHILPVLFERMNTELNSQQKMKR